MTRRRMWLVSLLGSGVVIALLVHLADLATLRALVDELPWTFIAGGLLLFQIEGLMSAVRVRLLAAADSTFGECLVVTAWWVAGLVVLPARLGEITGMHLLVKRLGIAPGAALNSLFVQRLFDALWLLVLGGVAIAAQSELAGRVTMLALIVAAALLLALMIMRLGALFEGVAVLCRSGRHWWPTRTVLGLALGGRHAARLLATPGQRARVALISLLKWLSNLAAVALIMLALVPLAPWAALGIAVLFNLACIVPVQTVGGIGVGDVSFTAALGWYGFDLTTAASAALMLRVALSAAPLIFWALVVGSEPLLRARRVRAEMTD